MKSPHLILDFTQQPWLAPAKQMQRLQSELVEIFFELGTAELSNARLRLNESVLLIQTSAAYCVKLRQIEPALLLKLKQRGWQIETIKVSVLRNPDELAQHMVNKFWISPAEIRYGKKTRPTPAQRASVFKKK
jgi:hypothetical protein